MADTLRIEHLSKTFTGQRALNDVSLSVAPGEVHALVGQNGSGKSTLIKILAGYHQPDGGGAAWIDDVPLTLGDGTAAAAAGIRFVHQDLGLVASVSAVENLALTAGYRTGFVGKAHFSTFHTFAPTGRPECRSSSQDYAGDWRGPYMGFQHAEMMIAGHNMFLPQKPPEGTVTVSTGGMSAMRTTG